MLCRCGTGSARLESTVGLLGVIHGDHSDRFCLKNMDICNLLTIRGGTCALVVYYMIDRGFTSHGS